MSHTPRAPQLCRISLNNSTRNSSMQTRDLEAAAVACESADEPETTSSEGQAQTDTVTSSVPSSDNEDGNTSESDFMCNICLETANDPVVSLCGHLYCWPCLKQWLEARPIRKLCPVCRAPMNENDVIPLYCRNLAHQEDPRLSLPVRPQRTEIEWQQQQEIHNGFHMLFGIVVFGLDFGILPAFDERYDLDQRASKFLMILIFLYNALLWFAEHHL